MSKTDNALGNGLRRTLLDGQAYISRPDWYRAWEGKDVVGTCRVAGCDGLMVAQPSHQDGNTTWHGAECLSCGSEVAIRSDRPLLRRSMRRAEMPPGSWEQREAHLRSMADLAKREAA